MQKSYRCLVGGGQQPALPAYSFPAGIDNFLIFDMSVCLESVFSYEFYILLMLCVIFSV